MKHIKCGGTIVLDLSNQYWLRSPAMIITSKSITPGMIQLESNPKGSGFKFVCQKCNTTFSTKEEMLEEIVENCGTCGRENLVNQIFVSDHVSRVCQKCVDDVTNNKRIDTSTTTGRILATLGSAIISADMPTLLTIMLKK